MIRPPFLEGVALALAASLGGGILYSGFSYLAGPGLAVRLLIVALGLGYALYLLVRSRAKVGRLVSLAGLLLLSTTAWLFQLPLTLFLLVHLGALWMLRALYFYATPLPALGDLGLQGLALAAAFWALSNTGSPMLAIWCFFLVQALFLPSSDGKTRTDEPPEDRFQRAHASAEAALRKLSVQR